MQQRTEAEIAQLIRKRPGAPNPGKEVEVAEPGHQEKNPATGEIGGPKGPEPTRYQDWERGGRVTDF